MNGLTGKMQGIQSRGRQNQTRQKGFSLIEVLISMLIFLMGIVGIVGLQGQAIRVTHDSFQRSQATWMAHEMIERMKVNPRGIPLQRTLSAAISSNVAMICPSFPAPDCVARSCHRIDMATYDISNLLCENTIINPQMIISCTPVTCDPGALVTVNVSWDSRGSVGGALSTRQELTLNMRR